MASTNLRAALGNFPTFRNFDEFGHRRGLLPQLLTDRSGRVFSVDLARSRSSDRRSHLRRRPYPALRSSGQAEFRRLHFARRPPPSARHADAPWLAILIPPSSTSSRSRSMRHARLADRHQDPAEIRIASEERGLDQRRVGDLPRHPLGIGGRPRAAHLDRHQLGRALAVAHQFTRQRRRDIRRRARSNTARSRAPSARFRRGAAAP